MNVDEYLDTARENQGIKSDRQLSVFLKLKPTAVNSYRTRRAWPSDEAMINLAKACNEDPAVALLDLNTWRAHGEAITIYSSMRKALAGIAAALVIVIAGQLAVPAPPAFAANLLSTKDAGNLYYGKLYSMSDRVYSQYGYKQSQARYRSAVHHCGFCPTSAAQGRSHALWPWQWHHA